MFISKNKKVKIDDLKFNSRNYKNNINRREKQRKDNK